MLTRFIRILDKTTRFKNVPELRSYIKFRSKLSYWYTTDNIFVYIGIDDFNFANAIFNRQNNLDISYVARVIIDKGYSIAQYQFKSFSLRSVINVDKGYLSKNPLFSYIQL